MGTDFVTPEQKSFAVSQAQAWRSVREQWREVGKTAILLQAAILKTRPPQEPESPNSRRLSALERLPEEVLIAIMERLDYESLYRLSQTTGYFLRLSFDNVFELDPGWRTFRHTIDEYFHEYRRGIGLHSEPRRRVLDWANWRARKPNSTQLVLALDPEPSGQPKPAQEPPEPKSVTGDVDDGDEGETMLHFMASRYRQGSDYAFETNGFEEDKASS
ncbi:hypothetical protein GGR51DRAFT_367420 [Nemania sp. FL0031]|nr:hypothetical protein GGR51DRAFT_367420 [Nemania sp. FL0031]